MINEFEVSECSIGRRSLLKALAALGRMMDNLEDYLALQARGGRSVGATFAADPANDAGAAPALPAPSDGATVNSDTGGPAKPAGGAP